MILAIDIGGSQFGLALASPDGRIIKHIQHQTDRADHADKRIDRILAASKTLISQSLVLACGIGFGVPSTSTHSASSTPPTSLDGTTAHCQKLSNNTSAYPQ